MEGRSGWRGRAAGLGIQLVHVPSEGVTWEFKGEGRKPVLKLELGFFRGKILSNKYYKNKYYKRTI